MDVQRMQIHEVGLLFNVFEHFAQTKKTPLATRDEFPSVRVMPPKGIRFL